MTRKSEKQKIVSFSDQLTHRFYPDSACRARRTNDCHYHVHYQSSAVTHTEAQFSESHSGYFIFGMALCALLISSCVMNTSQRNERLNYLHTIACGNDSRGASAWHISRLYDCESRTLFIPYQLWTGAVWSGDKSTPCMHTANSRFNVNGDSWTTITGPMQWIHPKLGTKYRVWSRDKVNGTKKQLFACHEKGIGRLYDSRRDRHYGPGRCKFPAGPGWKLFEKRACIDTAIQITDLKLNDRNELLELEFKWWTGETLDHVYRYAPDYGMTYARRQHQPPN